MIPAGPSALATALALMSAPGVMPVTAPTASTPSSSFDDRLDPAALDRALVELTASVAQAPSDAKARLLLARAEAFWVDLHPEAKDAEAIAHLSAGVEAARAALQLLSPGYAAAAQKSATLAQALQAIEPAAAPALYWIAADQHQLAAQRGLAALLLETDDLRRLFARVIELAPQTFHGGAYLHEAELALAVPAGYAASLETASGDLAQAEHFGPGWLRVDVVWAERFAVKAQDYALFQRKLARVLESAPDRDLDRDLGPENALARRKAKALLDSSTVLFTRAAIKRAEAKVKESHQRVGF